MNSRVAVMNDAARDGELDLGAVGRALVRKKWWVFGPAIAVAALTFVGVNLITPKYKSEARILIEGRENVFFRPEADKSASERDRTVDQEAVTSQVQLALSRDLARQVIKELKLGERPEFDSDAARRLADPLFARLPRPRQGPAQHDARGARARSLLRAADGVSGRQVARHLDRIPVGRSGTCRASVANAVADNYLALQQTARQDQTRAAGRWLSRRDRRAAQAVSAEAEAKVEDFRSKTNLFMGPNGTTLSNQTLGESNRDLAAARSQKAELESKAQLHPRCSEARWRRSNTPT